MWGEISRCLLLTVSCHVYVVLSVQHHRSGHVEEMESTVWLGCVVNWEQGWELRIHGSFKQEECRGHREGPHDPGASRHSAGSSVLWKHRFWLTLTCLFYGPFIVQ